MKVRSLIGVLMLGAACEQPPVIASKDPAQSAQLSHIDGNVVAQTHARGSAIVFLFDATRPPPPAGSGKPIAFDVVPKETLFGAAAGDPTRVGPFTAPFHFSLVPQGTYLIEGFIDLDGCLPAPVGCRSAGFIPWYGVTSEPNAGDVGGAYADPVTSLPLPVTIDATLAPVSGVNVGFTDANALPVDRPAFSVCSPPGPQCAPANGPLPLAFNGPMGVSLLQLQPAPLQAGARLIQPLFLAKYTSVVNGVPQPAGRPDLWPKVVLRKIDPNDPTGLKDENVDARGVPNGPQIALAGAVVPNALIAALTDPMGNAITTPVPVASLTVAVERASVDLTDPKLTPQPIQPGLYAIYLIEFTGQTWRLPNELAPPIAANLNLTGVATQGAVVEVAP